MRTVVVAAMLAAMASSLAAAPPKPDYAKAYGYALKCFVAGGVSMPDAHDDPDGTATEAARQHARKAFDTVYYMGGKMGYPRSRIAHDLDSAQGVEMRLMVQSSAYYARAKADCISLGLM